MSATLKGTTIPESAALTFLVAVGILMEAGAGKTKVKRMVDSAFKVVEARRKRGAATRRRVRARR